MDSARPVEKPPALPPSFGQPSRLPTLPTPPTTTKNGVLLDRESGEPYNVHGSFVEACSIAKQGLSKGCAQQPTWQVFESKGESGFVAETHGCRWGSSENRILQGIWLGLLEVFGERGAWGHMEIHGVACGMWSLCGPGGGSREEASS